MRTFCRATLLVAGTVVITAATLSGCTASTNESSKISGTAEPCIGPYIPNAHYTVRFVSVSEGSRAVAKQKNLTSPYKFSFTVPAGIYRVAAPGDGSVQARVEPGKTVTVALQSGCN
jgi:hypothetical protein